MEVNYEIRRKNHYAEEEIRLVARRTWIVWPVAGVLFGAVAAAMELGNSRK